MDLIKKEMLPASIYLDEMTINQLADFQKNKYAENTKTAYIGDIEYFAAWLLAAKGETFIPQALSQDRLAPGEVALPLPVALLKKYISNHLVKLEPEVDRILCTPVVLGNGKTVTYKAKPGPLSLATMERRLASLSVLHTIKGLKGYSNPCHDPEVRELFTLYKRGNGDEQKQSLPITEDILNQMMDVTDDTLTGIRDRALLAFGWATGGRRRSEICAATFERLIYVGNGYIYRGGKSKTNQKGETREFPLKGDAAVIIEEWLKALGRIGISSGPLFRGIDQTGKVSEDSLYPSSVSFIVKKLIKKIGLDDTKYSAHSLRSGYATESGLKGIPEQDAMALTDHKDITTFRRYRRRGSAFNNPGADIFSRKKTVVKE